MWCTNRLLWHTKLRLLWRTNPDFYAIRAVFIGGGDGLQKIEKHPPRNKVADNMSQSKHEIVDLLGNVLETPTPTTCLKSTAVHLQFVRQYAPHLYRRTFLASKLRRKGNPTVHLPFVLQYAPHLYGSTPPICTAVLLEKYWGLGSPERF